MIMTLNEFFPKFKRMHGMYVVHRTFQATCAYLDGFDEACGDGVMREFHSWLCKRGNGKPELYWPYLTLCEIFGNEDLPDVRNLTPEEDAQAVAVLFDLLDQFFGRGR